MSKNYNGILRSKTEICKFQNGEIESIFHVLISEIIFDFRLIRK